MSIREELKSKNAEEFDVYALRGYIPGVTYFDEDGRELYRGIYYDVNPVVQKGEKNNSDKSEMDKPEKNAESSNNNEVLQMENPEVTDIGLLNESFDIRKCVKFFSGFFANLMEKSVPSVEVEKIQDARTEETLSQGLNFELRLCKRIVKITDGEAGEIEETFYQIKIDTIADDGNMWKSESLVPSNKVREFAWITTATHSLAKPPADKVEKEIFQSKISRCISERNVEEEIIYDKVGWREVAPNCLRFITAEGAVGDPNVHVKALGDKNVLSIRKDFLGSAEVFDYAYKACGICKTGIASSLLWVYLHTALLTTIFEKAGFPVHFIFGLAGVTNSKKTSLALAMTSLFGNGVPAADAEFATATACGIEKTLSVRKDGIILVDDFKPGVDHQQQKMLNLKLDQTIRYYGNRIPKSRMTEFNKSSDKLHFPILGCCLITMEIVTGVLSSLSRMFVTELSLEEVDNNILGFYQKNPWIMKTHVYDFLSWVTFHMNEVVACISSKMDMLRNVQYHRFAFPRYNEVYATFSVTAEIIAKYAQDRGFWLNEEAINFVNCIQHITELELDKMTERVKFADKGQMVMNALIDALRNGSLMPILLDAESMTKQASAYIDEQFLYIRSAELRRIANIYAAKNQLGQEILNEAELNGLLERLEVIIVKQGAKGLEKSHHLPKAKGNCRRYLYIKKDKIVQMQME